jgi:WD40 repeat protein
LEPQNIITGHSKSVNTIDLVPDENMLASGSSDQTVKLWSFPDGDLKKTFELRKQTVAAVKFANNGKWLASGWYGGYVALWSLEGNEQILAIKANDRHVTSLDISPNNKIMATSGIGDAIRLWNLPSGDPAGELTGHKSAVSSLTFIRQGSTLVSMGYERHVIFWDMASQREFQRFPMEGNDPRGVILSPDESLAAIPMQGQVELRQIDDWSLVEVFPVSTKIVNAVAFSPDGKTIVASGGDGNLRVWSDS